MALEQVVKLEAEVGAVCHSIRVGEQNVVVSTEAESTILGLLTTGEKTLTAACLHLEPGIGAESQRQVSSFEAAVSIPGIPFIGCTRQAQPDVVLEPVMA